MTVRANWRIVFPFEEADALGVQLMRLPPGTGERQFRPMKNPPHPGGTVLFDCLEALGLSVTAGAMGLVVSRQSLSNVTNKSAISAEMAIRLNEGLR